MNALAWRRLATLTLLSLPVLLGAAPSVSAASSGSPCPTPFTTSPDGTVVYGNPCAQEIVVTSPAVRVIHAGEGDNVVHPGPNVEVIYGEGGNDTIYAGPNTVVVEGGEGEDVIYGEPPETETGEKEESGVEYQPASASALRRQDRRLLHAAKQAHRQNAFATTSTQEISCAEQKPWCLGGNGDQILRGGPENDVIFGERGNDEIYGEGGNDALYGGDGDDYVWGGEGSDFIAGGPGADHIYGEGGNDLVRGDGTVDYIYGGVGTDTVSFATAITPGFSGTYPSGITQVEGFPAGSEGRGVYVRLDGGATTCGYPSCDGGAGLGGGNDEVVAEVENVIGSAFADIIVGSSAANKIYGGGGADVIIGGGGADELFGGAEGDYIEGSSEAVAYGGTGPQNNCVGMSSKSECSGVEARVTQHEAGTMSAGLMMTRNLAVVHDVAYLVGSEGNDEVNASISGGTVIFSSYGSTRFAGESEGCIYSEEGKKASCPLPEGAASFDAVVAAGMKGSDHLAVGGGGFELTTSPQLLGGEGSDTLTGSGTTEDVLVDGNGTGADVLKGYGYDDWLLNNEGVDLLEGGPGNDLLLSTTTCDGDTLNGAEEGAGGDGEAKNNASWAKLPASSGGVTADLATQSSGSYWNGSAPACTSGSVDHLYGMDDLEGSNQSDALFGNSAANSLYGHKGEDVLHGEAGNDRLLARDEEKDNASGGEGEDTCYIDRGLDEVSGCEEELPPPINTSTYATVSAVQNGEPGHVTVTGHVTPNSGSVNGLKVNVNFEKKEGGTWVYKNTDQVTLAGESYEAKEWAVGAGEWRTRSVFPGQGEFAESQSEYHPFTVSPPRYKTETFLTIGSVVNGQPGSVSFSGHVNTPEGGGPVNGQVVNVNFEKEEGGKWVYKNTDQVTVANGAYEASGWRVGVGNWRARAVFPEQGFLTESQSEYHTFTVNPTGYTTQTFLTIGSVVNGQPGNVSLSGHVNVTTEEGGPINGLYVNVNFDKEEGGKWVYKNSAHPTITNSYYEVNNWSVGVGNWRVRAVFPTQGYYEESMSEYHYFTVSK